MNIGYQKTEKFDIGTLYGHPLHWLPSVFSFDLRRQGHMQISLFIYQLQYISICTLLTNEVDAHIRYRHLYCILQYTQLQELHCKVITGIESCLYFYLPIAN